MSDEAAAVPLLKSFSEFLQAPIEIPCLIPGIIPRRSLVAIVGESGSGKTFIGAHVAVSVASGRACLGGRTGAGNVLYVAAEGVAGLPMRLRAMSDYLSVDHKLIDPSLAILPMPLDFSHQAMVERVIAEVKVRFSQLDLIIVDTYAANLPGGSDENSAADTETMMKWLRYLVSRTGATVLVVHHKGHNSERERGSSAFRAALDGLFFVKKEGALVTMTCSKSRDLVPFEPICFTLESRGASAVLVPAELEAVRVQPSHRHALSTLVDLLTQESPVKPAAWRRALGVRPGGMPESTFYRLTGELRELSMVAQVKGGYLLTRAGEDLVGVAPNTPTGLSRHSHGTPTTPTPLKGGGGRGVSRGRKDSHETPTGLPRELGPGLAPVEWGHFEEQAAAFSSQGGVAP